MTATLLITLCLTMAPSYCRVHEVQVEASSCMSVSPMAAQAWAAQNYPTMTIRRVTCVVGRAV